MKNLLLIFFLSPLCAFCQDNPCARIDTTKDDFSSEVTYRTPMEDEKGNFYNCGFTKVKKGKTSTYYLSLTSYGSTINVGKKGAVLILTNGQKVSFPDADIDDKVSDNGGFEYSIFLTVNPDKLALFKKYGIKKWQLYVYDNDQPIEDAEAIRLALNCISK